MADDTNIQRFDLVYARLCDQPRLDVVPRRHELSFAEFPSVVAPAAFPVIFSSSQTKDVEALRILRERYGDVLLTVRIGDYADPAHYAPDKRVTRQMQLQEYLELAQAPAGASPPYAGNSS